MRILRVLVILCVCLFIAERAHPFTVSEASILISNGRQLQISDIHGNLLDKLSVPYPGSSSSDLRDLVRYDNDHIALYNGGYEPYLSIYELSSNSWTHHTVEGWRTTSNGTWGGITALNNYLFFSDSRTTADDNSLGLIRFDTDTNTNYRFGDNIGYSDVSVGLDNKLYALNSAPSGSVFLDIYDPATLNKINHINFGIGYNNMDYRGITADEQGFMYIASWDGEVIKYDPQGNFIKRIVLRTNNKLASAFDIDISSQKQLLVSDRDGDIIILNDQLAIINSFVYKPSYISQNFVAWGDGNYVAPEPVSSTLFIVGGATLGFIRWRKKRTT